MGVWEGRPCPWENALTRQGWEVLVLPFLLRRAKAVEVVVGSSFAWNYKCGLEDINRLVFSCPPRQTWATSKALHNILRQSTSNPEPLVFLKPMAVWFPQDS